MSQMRVHAPTVKMRPYYLLILSTFINTLHAAGGGGANSGGNTPGGSNTSEPTIQPTAPTSEPTTGAPTVYIEPCVVTLNFLNPELEGLWSPNGTNDDQTYYTLSIAGTGPQNPGTTYYLYWNDDEQIDNSMLTLNESFWSISTQNAPFPEDPDSPEVEYVCYEYTLSNCIDGAWEYYESVAPPNHMLSEWKEDEDAFTMFDSDCEFTCTPYIETLNFDDSTLDGTWYLDESDDHYVLNLSDSDSYYEMYFEIIDGSGYWDVYEFDEDGDSTGPITYCHQNDITYCAGNWEIYDDTEETWVYDQYATSLYDDCTYTECDFSDVTEARC